MNPIHALSSYSFKILVNIILPPKNADSFVITGWMTYFCCNVETAIGHCPLLSVSHFSIAIVATYNI
jgi:hypothetical protein